MNCWEEKNEIEMLNEWKYVVLIRLSQLTLVMDVGYVGSVMDSTHQSWTAEMKENKHGKIDGKMAHIHYNISYCAAHGAWRVSLAFLRGVLEMRF